MHTAFIGIGSNMGDRFKNCEMAIELILGDGRIKSLIKSKWYETKAVLASLTLGPLPSGERGGVRGGDASPDFINGVIKIETEHSPMELLAVLQGIEAGLGRVRRGKRWEPRTIDLDILFYDDLILNEPGLIIPHPEIHKRMFVLEPLCDIAPELVHPVFGKTIAVIASELK